MTIRQADTGGKPPQSARAREGVSTAINGLLASFGRTVNQAQHATMRPDEFSELADIETDLTDSLRTAEKSLSSGQFSDAAQRSFAEKAQRAFASALGRLDSLSQPSHSQPAQHIATGLEKDITRTQETLQQTVEAMKSPQPS